MQDAKQILLQDSLADVVRQLRSSRKSEAETIADALAGIKSEISSTARHVKVTAVIKLAYFAMLGYPGDHGAFHIIEVMADQDFSSKRAGYVAAAVILSEETPVLPLCTALLKRDMTSTNQYEVALALYCLSCVCTPDLARDLVSDVVTLTNNTRSYIRKKAVLCLFKIFLQFPDALRPTYPKLRAKIDDKDDGTDTDPAVRAAVVNVLCELARRNPANYLNLVPPFYSLLGTLHNNWTLIKIVKMFGYFSPHEPRLAKKLAEPIAGLMLNTTAKSVQYECILAVANGMCRVDKLLKLAVERMKVFVMDSDANLKYLGLDAVARVMLESPALVADQRDTVLACLADADTTIRSKSLAILAGLATESNLADTVNAMFDHVHVAPPDEDWSNEVVRTIIETVRHDDYALVEDFGWYLAVLLDLAQLPLTTHKHGSVVEAEISTVVTRVAAVRGFGVSSMAALLSSRLLLTANPTRSTQWMPLRAAAFLLGEYPQWVARRTKVVGDLLSDAVVALPADLQALCLSAATKLLAFSASPEARRAAGLAEGEEHGAAEIGEDDSGDEHSRMPVDDASTTAVVATEVACRLELFATSTDPLVQDRAQVLRFLADACATASVADAVSGADDTDEDAAEQAAAARAQARAEATATTLKFAAIYAAPLEPIVEGAQAHVALPDGLDLDAPFSDTLPALIAEATGAGGSHTDGPLGGGSDSDFSSDDSEDLRVRAARVTRDAQARRKEVDVFYLKPVGGGGGCRFDGEGRVEEEEDLPPIESIDLPKQPSRHRLGRGKSQKMSRAVAKPAGYDGSASTSGPGGGGGGGEPVDAIAARLQHIKLDEPLGRDEALPTAQPYRRSDPAAVGSSSRVAGGAAAGGGAEAELEARRGEAAREFAPVTLVTEGPVRCSAQITGVKAKKDGFHVSFILKVTNASGAAGDEESGRSIHSVSLRVATPEQAAKLQSEGVANPPAAVVGVLDTDGNTVETASVCPKIKAGAEALASVGVVVPDIPADPTASPVVLALTFTEKKKDRARPVALPLQVRYFLDSAAPRVDALAFDTAMDAMGAGAACLAAEIPVQGPEGMAQLASTIRGALRLAPVYVLRDCVAMHGALVHRKKQPAAGNVALLLKFDAATDADAGDEAATSLLAIRVVAASAAMAEAVLNEATQLIFGDAVPMMHSGSEVRSP